MLTLFSLPLRSDEGNKNNVIFITLDGVRWQDIVGSPDPFLDFTDRNPTWPFIQQHIIPNGVFIGNREVGSFMNVSNIYKVSLPGYFNILSGKQTSCWNNDCGRITVPTFMEHISSKLKLKKDEVATFASWKEILDAIEHKKGSILSDGPQFVDERADDITLNLASKFLRKNNPRLLYIALNDPDRFGHLGQYDHYIKALRKFDS